MARCGCSSTCSCSVVAGDGVTVSGIGTAGNPYVISADAGGALQVNDTPTVNLTLLGSGTEADPHIISAAVNISAIAGNLVTAQVDGLAVTCESIQDCMGTALGNGLQYNDGLNLFSVFPSADAGNAISIGGDGGIFAPVGGGNPVLTADTNCINLSGDGSGVALSADPIINAAAGNLLTCTPTGLRAALTMGACGLTGDGSAASPLAANTQAWPFACDVTAGADGVYCDANGELRSPPPIGVNFNQQFINVTVAATAVPAGAGAGTMIAALNLNLVNPSTCRTGTTFLEIEVDADFNLPSGGGTAELMIDADVMWRDTNTGSSAQTAVHSQGTKVVPGANIAPGGNATFVNELRMRGGAGGATYTRYQLTGRAWVFAI